VGESWRTFDSVAANYDVVRPAYPHAVFDAVEGFVGHRRPRVLEVGVGSGQATRPMAKRGWDVVGVEPGSDLIALASERLGSRRNVSLIEAKFEEVDVPAGEFDVVASATAWHWVDPNVGYRKAWLALRPRGVLALWWNAHVTDAAIEAWRPIREVYERIAPDLVDLPRLTPDRPAYDPAAEVVASNRFWDVHNEEFGFSVAYTADQFVALTHTYASHRDLAASTRASLDEALIETIDGELGGTVHKPYEAYLVLARRLDLS
jgi:SAM-dependent methyltransferase